MCVFSIFLHRKRGGFITRTKKYPNAMGRTFYIDKATYYKVQKLVAEKLGKSLSELVNEYFIELIGKLEGSRDSFLGQINYEGMKHEYAKLVEDVRRLTVNLYKAGVYDELKALALELGLDLKGLTNVSEVSAKLLDSWDRRPEYVHLFISLLEAGQRKKQLEKKLTEIRKSQHSSIEVNANGETNTIQGTQGLSQMRSNGA
ncbi:MAG: hypothetical protein QXV85_09495 [Candidatus Bathyarchaeia archaeon]